MGGGHSHGASGAADHGRAFAVGIGLNLAFVLVEAVFGLVANSMALLADAGHNLSDVLGLLVAWAGASMARRQPTRRFTYGFKKASILAALANALFLLVAVGAIGLEAVRRLFDPAPTEGATVAIVAAFGIVINGATALMFASGRRHDINIRGAFLHMTADAAVSAGVVIGGVLIILTGARWLDPAISIAVAILILWSSIGLLKESVWMSLGGVPAGLDLDEIEQELRSIDGIASVHDLHVWPLSTTETALTVHLSAPSTESTDSLLAAVRTLLHDRFHIAHSTIQIECQPLDDCQNC